MSFKKVPFEEDNTTQGGEPELSIISKPKHKNQSIKVSEPKVEKQRMKAIEVKPITHQRPESAESVVPWISLKRK